MNLNPDELHDYLQHIPDEHAYGYYLGRCVEALARTTTEYSGVTPMPHEIARAHVSVCLEHGQRQAPGGEK